MSPIKYNVSFIIQKSNQISFINIYLGLSFHLIIHTAPYDLR